MEYLAECAVTKQCRISWQNVLVTLQNVLVTEQCRISLQNVVVTGQCKIASKCAGYITVQQKTNNKKPVFLLSLSDAFGHTMH